MPQQNRSSLTVLVDPKLPSGFHIPWRYGPSACGSLLPEPISQKTFPPAINAACTVVASPGWFTAGSQDPTDWADTLWPPLLLLLIFRTFELPKKLLKPNTPNPRAAAPAPINLKKSR